MTELVVSLGKADPAEITATWKGTFHEFVNQVLKGVRDTDDKAARGWICGAHFTNKRRHMKNFVARHLLSFDYDHLAPADVERVLDLAGNTAFLAYTTWSHTPDHPRLRVWIPLSRGVDAVEFQAISRKVAGRLDIELAARESHTPAQFMYRPASQAGIEFQSWQNAEGPILDADAVLGEYDDYKDRSTWPHRKEHDSCHDPEPGESPLEKPGIVGEWCRTFRISEAIERFGLPYAPGSSEGRWTYTAGSRADGAVAYDDDTKLHSYHDTDPARGQHNAYDLVRLHLFGALDGWDGDAVPIADRESSRRMAAFAAEQPEIIAGRFNDVGFTALPDEVGSDEGRSSANESALPSAGVDTPRLPAPIPVPSNPLSDLGNARRIQRRYGKNVIAVGEVFYTWTGTHWIKSDTSVVNRISELSGMILLESESVRAQGDAEGADSIKAWAGKSAMAGTIGACAKLLRTHLDFSAENLNADRGLLTCRTGTVDLRTGHQREHRQNDFITCCAPTPYDPAAAAPRFQLFLREIFKGDEEVVAFAQRWFGYCITGEVREHALVFHIGEGGNGKSKLMEALQHVLGPGYAGAGARGLLSPKGQGASPEVTQLLGKRMVTLSESNRDEAFDEGVLKQLTGGDLLTARNLYEGYFTFHPTHKLQLFTNHEPKIIGQDRGLWRRLFLLRYEVKYGRDYEVAAGIAQELQDEELGAKLAAESAGILAWLVQGAQAWYRQGLNPPAAVRKATEEFRARQDLTGQFLAEKTVRDPKGTVKLSNSTESLLVAYKGWMRDMGYHPLGRNKFRAEVERAAPYAKYDPLRREFTGLRLASDPLEDQ